MKNKKENVAIIAVIIVIVAITIGVFGWMFAKKSQAPMVITNNNNQDQVKPNNEKIIIAQKKIRSGAVVYKIGKKIISYNPEKKQEKIIFYNDKLLDFDISNDGKFLVYSLSESDFIGNSDIYFLDIENKKTTRLTEKNNIASMSPKIYSNGKKVAYLRRTFDTNKRKLRDGEIWTIDATGNQESSSKIYGDESKSWFDIDPNDRCCDCEGGEEKPYEPTSMLELKSITNDGRFVSFRKGSFDLLCFAGFEMEDGVYDTKNNQEMYDTEILTSLDNKYYAQLFSSFPSDPFPFCIKGTFFEQSGKLAWDPDGKIDERCQHNYYYRPLDFQITGDKTEMVYIKKSGENYVLASDVFNFNDNIEIKISQENSSDILYSPKVYFMEDGNIDYTDNIVNAKQIGNFVVFSEQKYNSKYPTLNVMDMTTKTIQKTIQQDNSIDFKITLSE